MTHTHSEPTGGERKAGHAVVHAEHGHGEEHGHGHEHGAHPFLQHHFDTPQQQFDAGKLGIWLFLAQEILFFAGLFCAYTVYRAQYPEIFDYAHYFLDTNLGALNTIVLILSSLTAAWAVRCAQLKNQKALVLNIVVTIACACTFMVVKYFEYSHKVHDGLLWGKLFNPAHGAWELESFKKKHPESAELAERIQRAAKAGTAGVPAIAPGAAEPVPPQVGQAEPVPRGAALAQGEP
jgi:cytochrome c oxidase subunit III